MLGVRGLKNNSIIPVKNPYLVFDIDGFEVFELYKDQSNKELPASQNIIT